MSTTTHQGAEGAETMTAGQSLDLRDLHAANIARQAEWCPDQVPDLPFRGNELGGECGEAQNVIKKLERERQGWRGSRATKDDLADELADVVICADLCAVTADIDLGAAVRRKFNATSEKQGLSVFLPMPATPAPATPPGVPDSVRALSEAATQGELNTGVTIGEWGDTICAGPTWTPIARFERQEDAEFFAAAGSHVRTLIASHPAGQSEDEAEPCVICDKPLIAGQRAMQDVELGTVHAACCGPEREAYVKDVETGEPLGPNDPIPQGYVYEPSRPAGQSAGSGAETDDLVDRFSAALKVKLRAAEAKYGWKNGWLKSDWQVECQNGLLRHVGKGDPLDVAAYAAFCWHHGWPSASRRSTDFVTGAVIPTAGAIAAYETRYPEGSLSETSDNAIEAWNRVAVAACLAEMPAPDSTSTGQGEAEGFVLMPVEPTEEMLEAFCDAHRERWDAVRSIGYRPGPGDVAKTCYAAALAARPAAPEAQGAWHWTDREGHPVRDAEQGEQWLLTWSEASATYDINCIDGDWPHGDAIKLLCMDAWKWIEASPPAPPASSGQGGR